MIAAKTRTHLLTVCELVDLYINFRLPELAPASQTLVRRALTCYVDRFGHECVEHLARRELLAWIRDQECWRSPSTKKGVLNRIKAVFGWALREGDLIQKHPYQYISWEEAEARRPMKDEEYMRAWAVAPPLFRRLLHFLKETGCRPGEAASLRWPMLDPVKQTFTLHQHKTAKKTGKPRIIYLGHDTMHFVRMIQGSVKHRKQGDLVFCNARGSKWTSCQMSVYWRAIRAKAGLPNDCILYGLRHRYGTLKCMMYEPATVQKLMGHSTLKSTMHYCHISEHHDHLLEAAGAG